MATWRFAVLAALWAVPLCAQPVDFTPEQRAWMTEHPVIRVACANSGPFAFRDDRGQLAGLSIDYARVLSARSGVRFEPQLVDGLEAAFQGVRDGRFDAVMGIGRANGREAFLSFSAPFAYSPDAMVTRTDGPYVFDIRELGGKRVGLARTSTGIAQTLREQVPSAEVVPFETTEAAIIAVSKGDVFAAITDASIAAFTVKRRVLANLHIAGLFNAPADMYIGVRRDWPQLVSILDTLLASLSAAERMQLANRWTVLDYESDRRWQKAFITTAAVLSVVCLVMFLFAFGQRKVKVELALRRRIQADLEATQNELEKTSKEKTELLRMVAHDLRNPLTSLMLNTEHLTLGGRPDEETLTDIKGSIDRMRSLIALLVDRQALEEGRPALTWTRIDPGKETVAAIAIVSEVAKRKGIDVVVKTEPELPEFESDPGAFRQVVDNLVSNAVKYSPPGTSVRVDVLHTTEALRIAVHDQGPGVPPGERVLIFKKYQVGSARPTGGEASTGLGLWIVSRIVEQMKGRVWCEPERGQGSVFVVELPFVDAHHRRVPA